MTSYEYSLTQQQIAASVHGAGHVRISGTGVQPSHFTSWVTDRVMSPVFTVVAAAAGGAVLRLETSSTRICIEFASRRLTYTGEAPPASFVAVTGDLEWAPVVIDQHLGVLVVDAADDSISKRVGPSGSIVLQRPRGGLGTAVDIYLPTDAAVTLQSVSADAPLRPRTVPRRRRWLHHGSSVSQGGSLGDPRLPWPVQAARALDVDVINASLPGNCLLDPCVAEELADLDADVVSLELGINVANWDSHVARTFVPAVHHVLDQFHRADPSRQVVVISPFHCGMYEDYGGSLQVDEAGALSPVEPARSEALTLSDIRCLMQQVVESRPGGSVVLVDGRSLLGPEDQHLLTDGLHPDAAGAALIAARFTTMSESSDGGLGRLFTLQESVAGHPADASTQQSMERRS